jgi:hypothetical protein
MEARFRDAPGLQKIKYGEYLVYESRSGRPIDLGAHWQSSFLPGRRMVMSLVFVLDGGSDSSRYPYCFADGESYVTWYGPNFLNPNF